MSWGVGLVNKLTSHCHKPAFLPLFSSPVSSRFSSGLAYILPSVSTCHFSLALLLTSLRTPDFASCVTGKIEAHSPTTKSKSLSGFTSTFALAPSFTVKKVIPGEVCSFTGF